MRRLRIIDDRSYDLDLAAWRWWIGCGGIVAFGCGSCFGVQVILWILERG